MKSAFGRKTIIILFFIALTIECSSQVTEEWNKTYNGPGWGEDNVKAIGVDNYGNVYVTGSSYGSGTDYDYATIRYNSAGMLLWARRYDYDNGVDEPEAITIDGNGNIYVTGVSYSNTTGNNYATIKYNSAGTRVWIRRYIGPDEGDHATSIAVDGAGNVYVTGYSWKVGDGYDIATIKYNSSGSEQWVRRYATSSSDYAYHIAVDNAGNVFVSGFRLVSTYNWDFVTVKYNSGGTQQWVRTYDGSANGYDEVNALTVDNEGNVYVTGRSMGLGTADDYATIKYNSAGTQQWVRRYTGDAASAFIDKAKSIAVDGAGNVYVTGYATIESGFDIVTIKYTSNGNVVWVREYNEGSNFSDFAEKVVLDAEGNVYISGTSRDDAGGDDLNFVTIKYNSSGTQQWIKKYDGTGNALSKAMTVDNSGNVYVAGNSDSEVFASNVDFRIIKYSQTQQRFGNEVPLIHSLSQNYPNPFNPVTKISFSIPANSYTKLTVYDISGKQVAELVNSELEAGSYNIDFDASHLSSGTYFYKLVVGDNTNNGGKGGFTEVKKMILIK